MKGHFASVCKTSKHQEQKNKAKEKSENGGVNCLKSSTECEEDEYYALQDKSRNQAQKMVLRPLICKLVVWLL